MSQHEREYIRHPIDIPIEVSVSTDTAREQPKLSNISQGGLAFIQDRTFASGTILEVCIPYTDPALVVEAQVVWCHPKDDNRFEIGVRFLESADAFSVRMVEQVCHIEQYKRDIEKAEGRRLSGEEAASEWIEKYASRFPWIH
jgi:Tfp pilus assembly protein PilZ